MVSVVALAAVGPSGGLCLPYAAAFTGVIQAARPSALVSLGGHLAPCDNLRSLPRALAGTPCCAGGGPGPMAWWTHDDTSCFSWRPHRPMSSPRTEFDSDSVALLLAESLHALQV